jgi:dipeptidyl aminopeptidase/acylaminoacyl peptidase
MKHFFKYVAVVFLLSLVSIPAYAIDEDRLRVFLDGADYWNVRLSPDGKHVSLITKQDDRNTLVVMDLETMQPIAAVKYTEATDMEIAAAEWINKDLLRYHITRKFAMWEQEFFHPDVFLLTPDGKKNTRIWSIEGNFETNSPGAQNKGDRTRGFPFFLTEHPDNEDEQLIYVRSFERRDGAGRGGIYRLNLKSGNTREYAKVPHFTDGVISSEDAQVFVATITDREAERGVLISHNRVDWVPLEHNLGHLSKEFQPFEIKGDYLYARAQESEAIDAGTHLIRYNIATKEWEDVYKLGFASVEEVAIGDDGEIDRIQYINRELKLSVLDKSDKVSQVIAAFSRSYEGFDVSAVSVTDEEDKMLIHVRSGAHAGEYFLFDFATKQAKFLLAAQERIDGNELSELEDATFTASDGVTIPGWFQAPRGQELPPLVVYIHGGPHGPYNAWGFNPRWHLLNEMGYAVYAPNFRGSGGYGPNFEYAGYGQWGSRMIDDMYEGVQALIERGKVNPDRVCVYGGSYGGYASTQSLVRHNDFYKCGVIIAGVFDLKTMMKLTDIADSYLGDDFMAKAIGATDEKIREFSPMQNIDKIKAPMLIHHGEVDERTPFKDAVLFVDALKEKNKRFEYKWYPKEGHGNRKMENRIDEWQRIQAFLGENL